MPRYALIIMILCAVLQSESAQYDTGKSLYLSLGCASCHGIDASGTGNYPALANRAEGFLAFKLRNFREGKTRNSRQEMMVGFVQGLKDDQIAAIAHYLHHYHEEAGERYDPPYETWGDGGS